jgi:transcriptional regulator with XRE-family HTH domain
MENHNTDIGTRIAEAIGDEPVKAFARRCGVPESSIRDYVNRGKMPGLETAATIASATGVTIDWLATGRGVKFSRDLRILPTTTASRWSPLITLVEGVESDSKREAIMTAIFARATELKRLDDLEAAVHDIQALERAVNQLRELAKNATG